METLLLSLLEVASVIATALCFKGEWFAKLCVASVCWLWAMYSLTAGNYLFLALAVILFVVDTRFVNKS